MILYIYDGKIIHIHTTERENRLEKSRHARSDRPQIYQRKGKEEGRIFEKTAGGLGGSRCLPD